MSGPGLPISGLVICQDEAAHIGACLASLADCAEIVVVDSGSTDDTLAIVERHAAAGLPIVLRRQAWLGYAAQKQFALGLATQPWCLSLDADERLDAALRADLPRLIAADAAVAGWRLPRLPSNPGGAGPPPRGVFAKPILRLVRRTRARFDERALVHEGFVIDGAVRTAPAGLIWHDNDLSFADQLRKDLGYATLKARERAARGKRPSLMRLLFNPLIFFVRIFVLHRWCLCGRAGFALAVNGAVYAFAAEQAHFELATPEPSQPTMRRGGADGAGPIARSR